MSQILPEEDWPDEGSTFFPIAAFTNEDKNPVIPETIKWTLTDGAGNIMNSRENVVVVTPAESIEIKLTGDDLILETSNVVRILLVKATYNSSRGSDQTLNRELLFEIIPILKIP